MRAMADDARAGPGGIVLLCTDCPASRMVFHQLTAELGHIDVVVEDPVPTRRLLRRRLTRLGPGRVLGQLLFMGLVVPAQRRRSRDRVEAIRRKHGLVERPLAVTRRVPSVNSAEARAALADLRPSVVVVCGTRIIGADTLRAVTVPVVNFHAGITPAYRGVHGGYWALAEGRPDLVGSTVHLVDEGIDTGAILEQRTFEVTGRDCFVTYPFLHVAAALPALVSACRRTVAGEALGPVPPPAGLASRLRTHPTLWGWAWVAVTRGVR